MLHADVVYLLRLALLPFSFLRIKVQYLPGNHDATTGPPPPPVTCVGYIDPHRSRQDRRNGRYVLRTDRGDTHEFWDIDVQHVAVETRTSSDAVNNFLNEDKGPCRHPRCENCQAEWCCYCHGYPHDSDTGSVVN